MPCWCILYFRHHLLSYQAPHQEKGGRQMFPGIVTGQICLFQYRSMPECVVDDLKSYFHHSNLRFFVILRNTKIPDIPLIK
jgi:hypothetical protein